jgi:transposase
MIKKRCQNGTIVGSLLGATVGLNNSNMGNDIKRFSSAKPFACWLRLVPSNKLSSGHIISNSTPKGKNVIAIALRQTANSIGNQTDHPLAPFFKRIAYRKGRNVAITATARKLALII